MPKQLTPIHPGEILKEEFLAPLHITEYRLAKDIKVPARRINEIVHGLRSITADTALRLAKYFNVSAEFWMNLQAKYELETTKAVLLPMLTQSIAIFTPALATKRARV